jgi:hypothetical protein
MSDENQTDPQATPDEDVPETEAHKLARRDEDVAETKAQGSEDGPETEAHKLAR